MAGTGFHVLEPLDEEITNRLRAYRNEEHRLKALEGQNKKMQADISGQEMRLNQVAAAAGERGAQLEQEKLRILVSGLQNVSIQSQEKGTMSSNVEAAAAALAASGTTDHHQGRPRSQLEKEKDALEEKLRNWVKLVMDEEILRAVLEAEKTSLLNWAMESGFSKDPPPYAVHCTSVIQINAVHILKTLIDWPQHYVFRISTGRVTSQLSKELLENYARICHLEVMPSTGAGSS